MRILVGLVGLFNAVIGLGFMLRPVELAGKFALSPIGTQGLATLRADFPAFFLGVSAFALAGAWSTRADLLRVPMLLLGLALFGRCIALAVDGAGPDAVAPMVVEVAMLAILFIAARAFAAHPH